MNTCVSKIFFILLLSVTCFNFSLLSAQCAGVAQPDLIICDLEQDSSFQTFNLFSLLSGETPGGEWTALNSFNTGFLDRDTGIVNLWLITDTGDHSFSYTNATCDNSVSTVTIRMSGYPGESNTDQDLADYLCQTPKSGEGMAIDLFTFVPTIDEGITPSGNGTWTENPSNPATGLLVEEIFFYAGNPIGVYSFIYTLPETDFCPGPGRSIVIDVEVLQPPVIGISNNISVCETDTAQLNALTNLDLFTTLVDTDLDGQWGENTGDPNLTWGEITSPNDSEINVLNIYNNFGPGIYNFSYLLMPDHPKCEELELTFTLCIEKQLVLDDVSLDITCNNVTLNYDSSLLDNGAYDLSYTLTGANFGTRSFISSSSFLNGQTQFDLNLTNLLTSEVLTLTVVDITGNNICIGSALCSAFVDVTSLDFSAYVQPQIIASQTSQCEIGDIEITYNNTTDALFLPLNGNVTVEYSINGTSYTDDINFSNGSATTLVPIDRFSSGANSLEYFVSNTFINNCDPYLTSVNLSFLPTPVNPDFLILPDDICNASLLQYGFDSPFGEFISYSSVSFDMYAIGNEPGLFEPRDPNASLSSNTTASGIDIDIDTDVVDDLSTLPVGEYVYIIRSVQNDNDPCRTLSQTEIDFYANLGIDIELTKVGTQHIFDARLIFKVGESDPIDLQDEPIQVCLENTTPTLSDLPINVGSDVVFIIKDITGLELDSSYQITKDEVFVVEFNSSNTGCDLGSDTIGVVIVSNPSKPVLNSNTFCSLATITVADLDTSNQNIVWYDSEFNGTAYNTTDVIIPGSSNAYWAELTVLGGCTGSSRTEAEIDFIDKPLAPLILENNFCVFTSPRISDLNVQSESNATLIWYTSETGDAYTSTALPLEQTMQYWVSQVVAEGCESDRVRVNFVLTDLAEAPIPTQTTFCDDFSDLPILNEGPTVEVLFVGPDFINSDIFYFTDAAGTLPIDLTEPLFSLSSPIYVKQIIENACESPVVPIAFEFQDAPTIAELSPITLCEEDNPSISSIVDILELQTSTTITLYEDETGDVTIPSGLSLNSFSGLIYASQTSVAGCESPNRALVSYNVIKPAINEIDFSRIHCAGNTSNLDSVYIGTETVLWFDSSGQALLPSTPLVHEASYFARIQNENCLSDALEVIISVIDVSLPLPTTNTLTFCGITEKTVSDLEQDDEGNSRFDSPLNYSLVWYDSNVVSTRNMLDDNQILTSGIYYAVYERDIVLNGNTITCESSSVAIQVDNTVCDENQVFIPDAFSPNGDNYNETFEIKNIKYVFPDYEIEIYNRYGRVVFKGDLEVGFWDGKSNQPGFSSGALVPSGVYFYVINFNRFNKKPLQGQVYLKR